MDLIRRISTMNNPPTIPKSTEVKPLKFGILGAAKIVPDALVLPARTHAEVVIYAVAARDIERARVFAKKHGIEKAYGSYQEVLDDPEVDVVYNPLPNGLHYEWTMKALLAGKHVLNEKPSANTAEETQAMFELAEEKGLVLLDAYHYRFHPATERAKEIVDSQHLGKTKHIEISLVLPSALFGEDDIRFDYSLGGGALMDLGCYTLNCIEFITSSRVNTVEEAVAEPFVPRNAPESYAKNVDRKTVATVKLENDVTATLTVDLKAPNMLGVVPIIPQVLMCVEGEHGKIEFFNYVQPTLYHYITIRMNPGKGARQRVEKIYKPKGSLGEVWWSTYRFQLEALVDRIRGRTPKTWVGKEDSVNTMRAIDMIYEKTGLGKRPKSSWIM